MTPADDRIPCIDCTNRSHHGYCTHLNCPCACNSWRQTTYRRTTTGESGRGVPKTYQLGS